MPIYAPGDLVVGGGDGGSNSTVDLAEAKVLVDADFTDGIYTVQSDDSALIVRTAEPDPNIYLLPNPANANRRVTVYFDDVSGGENAQLHIRAFPNSPANLGDSYDYWGVAKEGSVTLYANRPATGVQWTGIVKNPPVSGGGGGSQLTGTGGTIKIDGLEGTLGNNTVYIEGAQPGLAQLLFNDGVYIGTFVGPDGSGDWEPSIQLLQQGVIIGGSGTPQGKSTTINGGEYGISLNPGGVTGYEPVAINGRGQITSLSPAGADMSNGDFAGSIGMMYYFGNYLYICVDTDKYVRAKVDMSINGEFVQPALDHVRLKSPDGNAWRLTIDNAGVITTTIEAVV